jgi:hypothetical protein
MASSGAERRLQDACRERLARPLDAVHQGQHQNDPGADLGPARSRAQAHRTLAGVEAMAMLAKGQVRAVPANDMPAQRTFVHQLFGLVL